MSYTVLARRYRSRDFDELVGQAAIADTLKRAVERDRVAHAYLFCGTRGVGKTSLARILARTLNAVDTLGDCTAVSEAIMRGDDLDVIEIDGASNRGVEQARELIAAAGLSPARCPYRIYIIDEVHMLTSEAFNTLLKTMEEPPSHVKFILCTTEPHKVPATIRSRCQRFDFRPITTSDIATHLQHILSEEGLAAESGVLERVAALGRGSMRDALGVLERLLASGASPLTMEQVESTLGLPPGDLVLCLIDAVLEGDPATALRSAETLVQQGIALDQVVEALIDGFRGLMLQVTCGVDTELLDWPQGQRDAMGERALRGRPDVFAHAVAVLEAVARQSAMAASARAVFDASIVRLALSSALEEDGMSTKKKMTSGQGPRRVDRPRSVAEETAQRTPPAEPTKPQTPQARPPADKGAHVPVQGDLVARWAKAVEAMDGSSLQAAAALLEPVSIDGDVLRVQASGGGSAVLRERLQAMQPAVHKTFGAAVQLVLDDATGSSADAKQSGAPEAGHDAAVTMVSEVFDAEVVRVRNT